MELPRWRERVPDDRFVHRRAGHSEKVNNLNDLEFRVWVQYLLSADDFGVMRFSAVTLQADNDHLSNRPAAAVMRCLRAVLNRGLLRLFVHQNREYAYQHDWQHWQKVQYPRGTNNPCPPPEALTECCPETQELFSIHPGGAGRKRKEHSENVPRTVPETFQESSALMREGAPAKRLTANGIRLEANGSEEEIVEPRIRVIAEVVRAVHENDRADATGFHRVVEQALREHGLVVRREVEVPGPDPGRVGRIDLVVDGEPPIAIELDRRTGKGRSIQKLLAFDGLRVLVLRDGHAQEPVIVPGIVTLSCDPLPPALSGRVDRTIDIHSDVDVLAQQLLDAYPKQGACSIHAATAALREVLRGKPSSEFFALLERLEGHKRSARWADEGGKYIPRLDRYLIKGTHLQVMASVEDVQREQAESKLPAWARS